MNGIVMGRTLIEHDALQRLLSDGACQIDFCHDDGQVTFTQIVGGKTADSLICRDASLNEVRAFAAEYGFREDVSVAPKSRWLRLDLRSMSC